MELIYMWIKDYKNIKKQGFNLSSKYIFNYNEDSNKLILEEFREGIFNDKKLIDIIAVIGKNGSGKSNLLEAIKKAYLLKLKSDSNSSILVFLKDEEFLVFELNYDFISTLSCESKVPKINFSNENIKEIPKEIKNSHLIFYSPVFDFQNEFEKDKIIKDISTSFLFHKDGNLLIYKDLVREADFLYHTKIKVEKEPARLKIVVKEYEIENKNHITPIKSNYFNSLYQSWKKDTILENSKASAKGFSKHNDEFRENVKKLFKNRMNVYLYLGLSNCTEDLKNKIEKLHTIIFNDSNDFEKDLFSNDIDSLEYKGIETIRNFYTTLNNLPNECFYYEKDSFYILIEHKNKEIINSFIRGYEALMNLPSKAFSTGERIEVVTEHSHQNNVTSLMTIPRFFDFEWTPKLSSGEKAYLQLYSRIYNAIKINSNRTDNDNLLILIDEGELYFHPEWQRTYIDTLEKFIKALYDNFGTKVNYKIILTSHSPFVVSDLPKENVILLGEEQGELQNTFGANIYSLFKNSFFLKSSLGEFAQNKIKGVINDLSGEFSLSAERLAEIKYIISSIGEPLIKDKLDGMYLKKIDKVEKLKILDEKIQALQIEKEKLQSLGEEND